MEGLNHSQPMASDYALKDYLSAPDKSSTAFAVDYTQQALPGSKDINIPSFLNAYQVC